eukprot:CAMPEP_0202921440 /NCGR_PEP_ID=MMETSP1392-20130828/77395_1 /ASSEMBLY_ACC=CAM_ASM_000868 /TAXON_ID=225041 /ORGANISM="Chlamydomonas chlamydogama, Strain SAG 11-48b" /LENGTH=90 /DNA_ID=CAMNT_0049615011 /DNA_START=635 /DNA_END=908 /DNA_ORIENTATION=+
MSTRPGLSSHEHTAGVQPGLVVFVVADIVLLSRPSSPAHEFVEHSCLAYGSCLHYGMLTAEPDACRWGPSATSGLELGLGLGGAGYTQLP